jgi:hypothetical protein
MRADEPSSARQQNTLRISGHATIPLDLEQERSA